MRNEGTAVAVWMPEPAPARPRGALSTTRVILLCVIGLAVLAVSPIIWDRLHAHPSAAPVGLGSS